MLIGPKLREDKSDEARALYRALLIVQGDVSISFTSEKKRIADEEYMSLTLEYYGARTKSITSSASFRRLVPSFNLTANLVVVGVLCRVVLPRILAIGAGGDVYEFASAYGLPDKEVGPQNFPPIRAPLSGCAHHLFSQPSALVFKTLVELSAMLAHCELCRYQRSMSDRPRTACVFTT